MKDFRNLVVWQKAHELTLTLYRSTNDFPKDERFGLLSQLRRSVVSIPSNIAEGCGQNSDQNFARFLNIAIGSSCELEYQLLLSYELTFIKKDDYFKLNEMTVNIRRMLIALVGKLMAQSS